MTSKAHSVAALPSDASLDQLFLECAELETLVALIRQTTDKLGPAVDSGLMTPEHLMNLAFRIENAERGLIAVSRNIGDAATRIVDRRRMSA